MNVQDRIDRTVAEWPPLSDAQKAHVRTVLTPDVQAHVDRLVAAAPPLSPAQRDNIATLFKHPHTAAQRSALDELLEEK